MRTIKLFTLALLLTIGSLVNANAQTKQEIQNLLEGYCCAYYNDCFSPRQYVEGSLKVTSIENDTYHGKIKVNGTHTCLGQYIPLIGRRTYTGRAFKAELYPTSDGIRVKFWRWYEYLTGDGYWEGPCEKTIIP